MNLFRWIASSAVLCTLAACSTGPTIRSDYDRSADFSGYRTYDYFSPLGTDSAGYSSLLTSTLKRAVDREMQARGYVHSSQSPSLLINFSARVEDKTNVTQVPVSPAMGMGYYGYRGGFYNPWMGYGYETWVSQYTEGTLNIDLVDAARKQLVWEGVAIGRLTEKNTNQAAADAAVAQIFASYPFTAGSN